MSGKGRPFLGERVSLTMRLDPKVLEAVKKCAAQDLRSSNAQVEVLLREALRARGYLRGGPAPEGTDGDA